MFVISGAREIEIFELLINSISSTSLIL
ncbi:hypothetical protein EZS27_029375, partial [termite gut metagenome]